MNRSLLLLLLLTLYSFGEYLSQDAIDKMVQGAYYKFVSASGASGGSGQKRAVESAQGTVERLKKLAEDDPNQRYILSKVAELESQISLEQEEMSLKWQYARVASINELVPLFNETLAKRGPSFGQLHSIYNRMVAIDVEKSNVLASKINQKSSAVTNDIRNQMHTSFRANNYKSIGKTYSYAVKNRKYLEISDSEFRGWGKKIDAKRSADYLTKMLSERVAAIETMINESHLDEAKRNILAIKTESKNASAQLSHSFNSYIANQLNHLSARIQAEERRMVIYTLSLIKRDDIKGAEKYLQEVVIPSGVSLNARAEISQALLVATEGPQLSSDAVDSKVAAVTTASTVVSADNMTSDIASRTSQLKKEFEELAVTTKELYLKNHKAELKAQAKAAAALTAEQDKADAQLLDIQALFEKGKGSKAVKVFIKNHQFLYKESSAQLYIDTKKMVNKARKVQDSNDTEIAKLSRDVAAQAPDEKEDEALQATVEIYNLVERKNIDQAYGLFLAHEVLLEEHSYEPAFIALKRTVVKAYAKEQNL